MADRSNDEVATQSWDPTTDADSPSLFVGDDQAGSPEVVAAFSHGDSPVVFVPGTPGATDVQEPRTPEPAPEPTEVPNAPRRRSSSASVADERAANDDDAEPPQKRVCMNDDQQ